VRTRALAVLAKARGWKVSVICAFLCIDQKTCDAYLPPFRADLASLRVSDYFRHGYVWSRI
jgi:hypothetical protein